MSQPVLQPDTVYHVYTHANGFENLFYNKDNYGYFLEKYLEHIHPIAETYAYCLMPNHVHFMINIRSENEIQEYILLKKMNRLKESQEKSEEDNQFHHNNQNLREVSINISQQFSNLFNAYTKAINNQVDRRGSLFIPNFKRKEVTEESYVTQLIGYIHNNPVHHGFVKNITDWPYSSFLAYVSEKSTHINLKYMYDWFGSKELFIDFHKDIILPAKYKLEE